MLILHNYLWAFILTMILLILIMLLSYKNSQMKDSLSPFECGFSPQTFYRSHFSLHFFLIALLFLIFDIELILLYPFLMTPLKIITIYSNILCIWFLIILLLGISYEWNLKSLEWTTH